MYHKYPRTFHLPWSEGITSDDKIIPTLDAFKGQRVIVTKKKDGENTSLYSDHFHARSLDSRHHVSRDWVKQFWSTIRHDIPNGWRICGENLYAQHSIYYDDLKSYFYGFSIWNEKNVRLSWDETIEWFNLLNIVPVEILYDGIFNQQNIYALWKEVDWQNEEGYVVALADAVAYADFGVSTAKYVRANHVQTDQHWSTSIIVPNKLMKP